MQMMGQERIAASRQQVWGALYDAEVLRGCIPGCQSVVKESDERLRAIAEIKIGPIGARFNATVTFSDVDPLNAYTMTIEGQGGTVGVVKSGAKVRLADDQNGGTLLSYEVEAEVAGRLAQLGGSILDATAKQLAGKFFRQFGSIVAGPAPVVASALPATAAAAAAPRPQRPVFVAPVAQRGVPVAWLLALIIALLVGYQFGHAQRAPGDSDWVGLAIGLVLVLVAGAGFELGRRAAAPVVTLDAALLSRLSEEAKR